MPWSRIRLCARNTSEAFLELIVIHDHTETLPPLGYLVLSIHLVGSKAWHGRWVLGSQLVNIVEFSTLGSSI